MAAKNTRNSRSVKCNWKYPNCNNKTRDQSGYCQVHRPLASRISGDDLVYGGGETELNNRSRFIRDSQKRNIIFQSNQKMLEEFPIFSVEPTADGRHRAVVRNLTKDEISRYGVTITPEHKEGAVNGAAITRDDKEEAVFEASAIVAQVWAARIDTLEGRVQESVDVYDSAIEAIAYARDWNKEIAEIEATAGLAPNNRSISFSEDRDSKTLGIKIYHESKNNPDGFVQYDYIRFSNKLRAVDGANGLQSFLPHTTIDERASYSIKVDADTRKPKRFPGKNWDSPLTLGLLPKVSKLVAESNKFGAVGDDGRLRIPTGWEIRSQK